MILKKKNLDKSNNSNIQNYPSRILIRFCVFFLASLQIYHRYLPASAISLIYECTFLVRVYHPPCLGCLDVDINKDPLDHSA